MASAYNLKQKMLNIARAEEMLNTVVTRENHKTGAMERMIYSLPYIKKITQLNRKDINGLITAIHEEHKRQIEEEAAAAASGEQA